MAQEERIPRSTKTESVIYTHLQSRKNFLDPDHDPDQRQNRMFFELVRHPTPQKIH